MHAVFKISSECFPLLLVSLSPRGNYDQDDMINKATSELDSETRRKQGRTVARQTGNK